MTHSKHISYTSILIALLLLINSCAPLPATTPRALPGEIKIHFIDVGQGDAILIQTPDNKNILIDAGRNNTDALTYLQTNGVLQLDLVIASHPDADHIGGLDAIIDFYAPDLYMDNGVISTTQTYNNVLESLQQANTSLLEATGQTITIGDTILQIIPPPDDDDFDNNNRSIGVVVSYGQFDAAFTGDAETEEFTYWQQHNPTLLKPVEIYKSAHHGSNNGDTTASINTWQPEVIVIGVSSTNPYGHPTPEALALYQSINARIYRTDQDGDVVITGTSDGRYTIQTEH